MKVKYGNRWGANSGLSLTLLWKVTKVLVDGKPIGFKTRNSSTDASLQLDSAIAPGKKVTLEIDCAYVSSNKMIGLDINEPDDGVMPTPVKRWKQTVPIKPPATLTTALVTDPARDPSAHIKIERLVVQNVRPDTRRARPKDAEKPKTSIKKLILKTKIEGVPDVDVYFDVTLDINDFIRIDMGHQHQHNLQGGGKIFGGMMLTGSIDKLDDDISTVDIEFTPNLEGANKNGSFKEIWGTERGLPARSR